MVRIALKRPVQQQSSTLNTMHNWLETALRKLTAGSVKDTRTVTGSFPACCDTLNLFQLGRADSDYNFALFLPNFETSCATAQRCVLPLSFLVDLLLS